MVEIVKEVEDRNTLSHYNECMLDDTIELINECGSKFKFNE